MSALPLRKKYGRFAVAQKVQEAFGSPSGVYRDFYDKAQCIFIHIPKCGGTSVSTVLYGGSPWHYTAEELSFINPKKFHRYYKFSVVRNPWERLYSVYRYAPIDVRKFWRSPLKFIHRFATFEEFIDRGLDEETVNTFYFVKPQTSYVYIDRQLAVDKIIKLERLDEDIKPLCGRFPQFDRGIPHINVSGPPVDVRNIYSPRMRDKVGKLYASDIEAFGYSYGDIQSVNLTVPGTAPHDSLS